jgi:D-psicose/D-tagatose/L-ribulose 3-epimerase
MTDLSLGLSTFVLASPFSNADLGVMSQVRAWGYDVIEVCVEDPSLLAGPASTISTAASSSPQQWAARW